MLYHINLQLHARDLYKVTDFPTRNAYMYIMLPIVEEYNIDFQFVIYGFTCVWVCRLLIQMVWNLENLSSPAVTGLNTMELL